MTYTLTDTQIDEIIERAAEAGASRAIAKLGQSIPLNKKYNQNEAAKRLGISRSTFTGGPKKVLPVRYEYGGKRRYWTEEDLQKYEKSRVTPATK